MNTTNKKLIMILVLAILICLIFARIPFIVHAENVMEESEIQTIVVEKEVQIEVPIFYPQLVEITGIYEEDNIGSVVLTYDGEEYVFSYNIEEEENVEETVEAQTSTSNTSLYSLTAYCPCEICCGEYANGITATGTIATANRTIAVDPNVIPYGTHVLINGKEYIAEDCGGAINGNRIDIYFDTHQEALNFGRQTAEVTILN